ncbi:MAG TPA: hypothetical protein VFX23_15070 [Limnobacter sp.]|uniref:hypothetical protein n=1 Tax=Limnobacter sp. TaxID=2003368 RepID=UPI002E3535B8|nr:hypothetical protein [Limnobacter sp.]HEX5487307.1 hypothetical protein [Limnobacter sp.]
MSITGPAQHLSFSQALLSLQKSHSAGQVGEKAPHEADQALPAVPQEQGAWIKFQQSGAFEACRKDLLSTTAKARQFIETQVTTGAHRQRALEGLRQFEDTKVNGACSRLRPLTFGLNRVNLKQVCKLLENHQIPLAKRTAVAAELFGSLGVCAEGEAIHIEDALVTLQASSQGLASKVLTAKNRLIEQHLISLVRSESNESEFDKSMEIHHVQGLKNRLAEKWGLTAREDKNIDVHFQEGLAPLADALMAKTVNPTTISGNIADFLHQTLQQNLPPGHSQWHSYDKTLIEKIGNILRVEFGDQIGLHDVLEVTDDYLQFRLKSPQAIQQLVVTEMGKLDLPVEQSGQSEPINDIGALIKSLGHLKNTKALQSRPNAGLHFFRLNVGTLAFQQYPKNNANSDSEQTTGS